MNTITLTVTVTGKPTPIPFKCCPFCGSLDLRIAWWSDDDGEYDAIECGECKGCAPADKWNNRGSQDGSQ